MLERLAIVCFLVVGLPNGARSQVPRDESGQDQKTQGSQSQTQSRQPAPLSLNAHEKTAEEKHQTDSKPSPYPWRELLAPANIPNWFLAIIGALGVGAAVKTLRAIKRQTDLQAAGMRQWVDVEAIDCHSTEPWLSHDKPQFAVEINFQAINNTANVLTIKKIETAVSMMPDETEVFVVEINTDLSPRRESESNRYPSIFKLNRFAKNGLPKAPL
jgi:hypothetical protein